MFVRGYPPFRHYSKRLLNLFPGLSGLSGGALIPECRSSQLETTEDWEGVSGWKRSRWRARSAAVGSAGGARGGCCTKVLRVKLSYSSLFHVALNLILCGANSPKKSLIPIRKTFKLHMKFSILRSLTLINLLLHEKTLTA